VYDSLVSAAILLALATPMLRAAEPFELRDGDRVVLIGNALIEREPRSGYWETMLTRRFPDRNIIFRNLGWSGDTVFGEARAGFDSVADGFRRLCQLAIALKPTVILVGYGGNEAFEGKRGLAEFLKGLRVLLDNLAPTKARIVLFSPLRQEDLGRPLPDPAPHNRDLRLYRDTMRDVARQRGLRFVDLYDLVADGTKEHPPAPLTDDGIHLTAYGYWKSAPVLERALGPEPPPWRVEIEDNAKVRAAQGVKVLAACQFTMADTMLPLPPLPRGGSARVSTSGPERRLIVTGLGAGNYTLRIDGHPITRASAVQWAAGVNLQSGPEVEQVEQLRKKIVEKNLLYFRRWRPENETYLFGFRRQEQGNNAVEIPQFDPLVARLEVEIARLRVPRPHRYELVLEPEKQQ
jgi:lysophospholipase L1-like esterase